MPSMLLVFRSAKAISTAFETVVERWRLSPLEADGLAGISFPHGRRHRSRRSEFVIERMALIVEIDAQLGLLMDPCEISEWLRDRIHGVFAHSALEEMFGTTDRIRRIRDLLEPEVRQ